MSATDDTERRDALGALFVRFLKFGSLAWGGPAAQIEILKESAVDVPAGVLAVAAFLILNRFQAKLMVLFVVLGCGVIGAALRLTVL